MISASSKNSVIRETYTAGNLRVMRENSLVTICPSEEVTEQQVRVQLVLLSIENQLRGFRVSYVDEIGAKEAVLGLEQVCKA